MTDRRAEQEFERLLEDWMGLITALSRRFEGTAGAECDDLIQEGRLACWYKTQKGYNPSKDAIVRRMQDWCRRLRAQIGEAAWLEVNDEMSAAFQELAEKFKVTGL